MKINLKSISSLLLGMCGIILIIFNLITLIFPPVAHPSNLGEVIVAILYPNYYAICKLACIPVFFISLIGLFLGITASSKRIKIAAIILNSFNLFLSLFIAWLLFGFARGM